jgi:hypothetical protein
MLGVRPAPLKEPSSLLMDSSFFTENCQATRQQGRLKLSPLHQVSACLPQEALAKITVWVDVGWKLYSKDQAM